MDFLPDKFLAGALFPFSYKERVPEKEEVAFSLVRANSTFPIMKRRKRKRRQFIISFSARRKKQNFWGIREHHIFHLSKKGNFLSCASRRRRKRKETALIRSGAKRWDWHVESRREKKKTPAPRRAYLPGRGKKKNSAPFIRRPKTGGRKGRGHVVSMLAREAGRVRRSFFPCCWVNEGEGGVDRDTLQIPSETEGMDDPRREGGDLSSLSGEKITAEEGGGSSSFGRKGKGEKKNKRVPSRPIGKEKGA